MPAPLATRAQHGRHVGYNLQSVVDAETHLIVTHWVTNQGHDRDLLTTMGKKAKAVLGRNDLYILDHRQSRKPLQKQSRPQMTPIWTNMATNDFSEQFASPNVVVGQSDTTASFVWLLIMFKRETLQ